MVSLWDHEKGFRNFNQKNTWMSLKMTFFISFIKCEKKNVIVDDCQAEKKTDELETIKMFTFFKKLRKYPTG